MVIRYTHFQLDLIEQAHPDVDLGNLVEVSFEFDREGQIVNCVGRADGEPEDNYDGPELRRLYVMARRQLALRAANDDSATIIAFPGRAA